MSLDMIDCEAQFLETVLDWFPDNPYAGYVTGGPPIEWSTGQFDMTLRKIRIAQSPITNTDIASPARVLDVERYAATERDWPVFWNTRTDQARATCYCSLLKVPLVAKACREAGVPLPTRWWLAWYWNHPGAPTVAQALAELFRLTGSRLDPRTVWAIQYGTFGIYDKSRVYGIADFSRE